MSHILRIGAVVGGWAALLALIVWVAGRIDDKGK
jgi:hypothetical protein